MPIKTSSPRPMPTKFKPVAKLKRGTPLPFKAGPRVVVSPRRQITKPSHD